ncbi:hypothetical protein CYY_009296 [Polysphondylium violaceum]|uniref:Uncharacterized protein n=1 Tax=Polysphondylium violaceum TaxID=133409 RepID=A0A8J4PLS9_9MYCE|nr:hypothetical protein CYY_009296 [Polysphondylium violaceum]
MALYNRIPYTPTNIGGETFVSISAMDSYKNKSHQEIRYHDILDTFGSILYLNPTQQQSFDCNNNDNNNSINEKDDIDSTSIPYSDSTIDGQCFVSISAMNAFSHKSHQEIRYNDLLKGFYKGSVKQQQQQLQQQLQQQQQQQLHTKTQQELQKQLEYLQLSQEKLDSALLLHQQEQELEQNKQSITAPTTTTTKTITSPFGDPSCKMSPFGLI